MKCQIELCAASVEAIQYAANHKVDRIELCQNLESGGLTPSLGLIHLAVGLNLETHILIRPRVGDFIYSQFEKDWIIAEMKSLEELTIKGFVIGASTLEGNLDMTFLKYLKARFPRKDFTLHRVIDDLPNPLAIIDQAIELNFNRILTAGGCKKVSEGINNLAVWKALCDGKIELMTGGGVDSENIPIILNQVQPHAIHFSATSLSNGNSGIYGVNRLQFDINKADRMVDLIRSQTL